VTVHVVMRGCLVAAVGAWAVAATGCSAGSPAMTAAAPTASAPIGDPRAQIEALDRRITDELARAQLAPPVVASCAGPACGAALREPFATPVPSDPACHPAPSERCTTACTLSSSICDNQRKLCELARQLDGDDWAANKCARARASCTTAHAGCCSCAG
jgi:hypothetical protein